MNLKSTGFFDTLHGAMRSFPVFHFLLPFLLSILLTFNGCSFFGSIGDAISDGYQNTVAYFNSYYNASRAFDDAEAEIAVSDKNSGIRGFTDRPQPLSNTARQRLLMVNDKCSNILQFYPSSALVDDALMLIGKSYYYQAEYLRAERKFTEFLSQYPDSPLSSEVRLWYVRTLARLKNNEEAIQVGESLLTQTETEGETDFAVGAADVLGVLYERMNQHQQSLAMYDHLQKIAPDNEVRAWGLYRAGQKLVGLQRLEDAASRFKLAADNSDDRQFKYQCLLERIRVLRSLGRHEESLSLSNEMLNDFLFLQYSKELQFERGLTHLEAGEFQAAEDDFVAVDTTAGRSELGARASFERAKLYEYVRQDYRAARDAYTRATSFPVAEIVSTARKKQAGLTRYWSLVDARMKLDSLIVYGSVSDSLPADSGAAKPPLDLDSLQSAAANSSYELGELFYIDIENPDSAVYWYGQALEDIDDSVRTPRIKYILAELALSYPTKQYADGLGMLRSIIERYPKSLYATRAKTQLGISLDPSETDNGEILYKKAEARIDSGDYVEAITTLRTIAKEFPFSPFASKSAYTIGWLYENRLSQPDSALSEYARLLQSYAGTPYAAVVRPRIRAIEAARVDSTGVSPAKKIKQREQ